MTSHLGESSIVLQVLRAKGKHARAAVPSACALAAVLSVESPFAAGDNTSVSSSGQTRMQKPSVRGHLFKDVLSCFEDLCFWRLRMHTKCHPSWQTGRSFVISLRPL